MRTSLCLSLAAVAVLAACDRSVPAPSADSAQPAAASTTAGESQLAVADGPIWYKTSGTGQGTPVILIHGGPGYSSYYLKPLEALGDDRPVVRYDQLGSGRSGPLADTTKMTIAHFVTELDSLRAHLGYDKVHLLGHSWGTIVAAEYYRVHPEHVASLTLGSPALDIPAWEANAKRLVKTLPDSMQKAITTREAEKKFDAPDYQKALEDFYGRYVWLRPNAADLDSMMKTANPAIYGYMQGPSEFTITGTLKAYDAKPWLHTIAAPVLFTVGSVDEANPDIVKQHAALIPGARVEVIPNSAHITTWDNPTQMIAVVRAFLRDVDAKR